MNLEWQTKALAETCQIKPPKIEARRKLSPTGLVSFVPMEDLGINQKYFTPTQVKPLDQVSGSYTYFADGDVLLAKITPCFENGKLGIAANLTNGIGFGSSEYIVFRPNTQLLREWLYYFLSREAFRAEGAERMSGAVGHKRVAKEFVESYPIPLPPVSEQKRIVDILDDAFDGIATAKANAEKNLQNARALFESHLESLFIQRGADWDRLTLEALLEHDWIESHLDGNHGSDYPRKAEFVGEGVPYISANCLDNDSVDMTRAKHLSRSRAALIRKGVAKNNDVLFAHNATVGPVAILHTDEEKVILGTSLTYYRCNPDHVLPEYLAHYMRSFGFKTQYLAVMRQSTRNQVPITKQREFYHVIPPIDDQKTIVSQLDGLLDNTQRLESIYQQKLAALEALKKSLLDQAFSGQL
jgi:type I restriction enzyme, S subunit